MTGHRIPSSFFSFGPERCIAKKPLDPPLVPDRWGWSFKRNTSQCIISNCPSFQELQVDREILLTSNRSLAEESIAMRPCLNNGKLQLAEKYKELANLTTICWEKQSRLGESTCAQERQRRKEGKTFMEGNVPLEGFLDSFQSSRKSYHIRRVQAEKIQELSRAKENSSKPKKLEEREDKAREVKRDEHLETQRPNGFVAQGPPRVFQLRYGLTPAILLPHFPLPTTSPSAPSHACLPPLDSQPGQTHILSPSAQLSGHGHTVNLRVIGQLSGGWPTRPVRLQQLYRPAPHQPEPLYR
uniref:VPS37 C-terminal domain-containing protein n=1 Tax=Hucho hucho TaxID=62062 RepID=A0A4W5NLL0_9TELE